MIWIQRLKRRFNRSKRKAKLAAEGLLELKLKPVDKQSTEAFKPLKTLSKRTRKIFKLLHRRLEKEHKKLLYCSKALLTKVVLDPLQSKSLKERSKLGGQELKSSTHVLLASDPDKTVARKDYSKVVCEKVRSQDHSITVPAVEQLIEPIVVGRTQKHSDPQLEKLELKNDEHQLYSIPKVWFKLFFETCIACWYRVPVFFFFKMFLSHPSDYLLHPSSIFQELPFGLTYKSAAEVFGEKMCHINGEHLSNYLILYLFFAVLFQVLGLKELIRLMFLSWICPNFITIIMKFRA